jgi:hypothetical protein
MPERTYNRQDVDAILGRALEREHAPGELTHDELIAAAREVGVAPEAIERAATEVMAERREREELRAERAGEWRGFVAHLIPYVSVNALLITLNIFTGRFPWALFALLGWGIGLLSHFFAVLFPNPERRARRSARKRDRERRRQAKQQLKAGARQLEHAVEQGVAALLHVAADRIAERAQVSNPGSPRVRVDAAQPSGGPAAVTDPSDELDSEGKRRQARS